MGQINVGNYGYRTANTQPGSVSIPNVDAKGQALKHLGNVGMDVGQGMINAELRDIQAKKQQQNELDRAKTANALLDHEIYTKSTVADLNDKIARGEVHYSDAANAFNEAMAKAPNFQPAANEPVLVENYDKGTKRNQFQGLSEIQKTVETAQRADYDSQFGQALDKLGKLAGLPGSDVSYINQQADKLSILGKQAGMKDDVLSKKLQDFKDANWFNQASQQVLSNHDDLSGLNQLKSALSEDKGFYADKLDPDKRTALMRTIDGHIDRIENRQQHLEDKREAKAERAINEIDKQIASTVPATPDMWADWESTIKGTTQETAFKQRLQDEGEVQTLLRKPLEEQAAYVQNKSEQLATKGGSLREQANLNRLKTAVEANTKLLKETPLLFNQNRTGMNVEPLNIADIATPEGVGKITAQLKDRFATVSALRGRYGQQVSLNPWLPQEADAIKQVIAKADDNSKLQILSTIAGASPDGQSYASALKSVADDKPITMLAGLAKYRDLKSTDGRDISKTLLNGEKILGDKSIIMPTDAAFKAAFEENVGNALPDGSPQREQAYTAFKALYAGMANDFNVRHTNEDKLVADSTLAESAAKMATGGVFKYNGSKVIPPYGMPEDAFMQKIDAGLVGIAKQTGYSKGQLEDMPLLAVPGHEGTYYLLNGKKAAIDVKTGKPLMVNVK